MFDCSAIFATFAVDIIYPAIALEVIILRLAEVSEQFYVLLSENTLIASDQVSQFYEVFFCHASLDNSKRFAARNKIIFIFAHFDHLAQ